MPRKLKGPHQKTAEAVRAGSIVRAARMEMNLSRQELSDRTGGVLSPSRIGNYEQGLRELGIKEAELLAPVLGTKAAYLMGLISETEHQVLKLPREAHTAMLVAAGAFDTHDKERPKGFTGRAPEGTSKPARLHRR